MTKRLSCPASHAWQAARVRVGMVAIDSMTILLLGRRTLAFQDDLHHVGVVIIAAILLVRSQPVVA